MGSHYEKVLKRTNLTEIQEMVDRSENEFTNSTKERRLKVEKEIENDRDWLQRKIKELERLFIIIKRGQRVVREEKKKYAALDTRINVIWNSKFKRLQNEVAFVFKSMKLGDLKLVSGQPYWHHGAKVSVLLNHNKEYRSTKKLSSGQKAIVSLSIILGLMRNLKLPLLLLDEVDGALDVANVGLVHSFLCNRMGPTQIIFVSHRFQLNTRLAGRNLILIKPERAFNQEGHPLLHVNIQNSVQASQIRSFFFKEWKEQLKQGDPSESQLHNIVKIQDLDNIALSDYRDEMQLSSDEEFIVESLKELDDRDLTQCVHQIHIFHRKLVPRIEELNLLYIKRIKVRRPRLPPNLPPRLQPIAQNENYSVLVNDRGQAGGLGGGQVGGLGGVSVGGLDGGQLGGYGGGGYDGGYDGGYVGGFDGGNGEGQGGYQGDQEGEQEERNLELNPVDSQFDKEETSEQDGSNEEDSEEKKLNNLIRDKVREYMKTQKRGKSEAQLKRIEKRVFTWISWKAKKEYHEANWDQESISQQESGQTQQSVQNQGARNRERIRKPREISTPLYTNLLRIEKTREIQQVEEWVERVKPNHKNLIRQNKQELRILKHESNQDWKVAEQKKKKKQERKLELFSPLEMEERKLNYTAWLKEDFDNILNLQQINNLWFEEVGIILSQMLVRKNLEFQASTAYTNYCDDGGKFSHQDLIVSLIGDHSKLMNMPAQFQVFFKNIRHLMVSIAGPTADLRQLILWKALEYQGQLNSLLLLEPSSYLGHGGLVSGFGGSGISFMSFMEMNRNPTLFFQRELQYWKAMETQKKKMPEVAERITKRLFSALISPTLCYRSAMSVSPISLPKELQRLGYYVHFVKEFQEVERGTRITNLQLGRMLKQMPHSYIQKLSQVMKLNKQKNKNEIPLITKQDYMKPAVLRIMKKMKAQALISKNSYERCVEKYKEGRKEEFKDEDPAMFVTPLPPKDHLKNVLKRAKQFEKFPEIAAKIKRNKLQGRSEILLYESVYLNFISNQEARATTKTRAYAMVNKCAIGKLPSRKPINWAKIAKETEMESKTVFDKYEGMDGRKAEHQLVHDILGIEMEVEQSAFQDFEFDLEEVNAELLISEHDQYREAMWKEEIEQIEERKSKTASTHLKSEKVEQELIRINLAGTNEKGEQDEVQMKKGYDEFLERIVEEAHEDHQYLYESCEDSSREKEDEKGSILNEVGRDLKELIGVLNKEACEIEEKLENEEVEHINGKKKMPKELKEWEEQWINSIYDDWEMERNEEWRKQNYFKDFEEERDNFIKWKARKE